MTNLLQTDWVSEVRLGNIPGTIAVGVTGKNEDIDTIEETIWTPGGDWMRPDIPRTHLISSSDAADTILGTGAQVLRISGVDGDGLAFTEDVDMNGSSFTPPTTTVIDVINSLAVIQSGSAGTNVGSVNALASDVFTLTDSIDPGKSRSFSAVYMTPKDTKTLLMRAFVSSVRSGNNPASIHIHLRVTNITFGVSFRTIDIEFLENTTSMIELNPLDPALEGSMLFEARAISSGSNTDVGISMNFIVEND